MKIIKPEIEDLFDLTVDDCETLIDALIHVRSVLCDDIGKKYFPSTLKVIEKALEKAGCTVDLAPHKKI